jgi:uncharacterized membrane protein YdjX (TVP38/TMEM64 family)
MKWLGDLLVQVGELGPWGPILFILLYVAAAITMAPAFLLSVAAGALFGVWRGSLLVFFSATLGAMASYGVARAITGTRFVTWVMKDRRVSVVGRAVANQSQSPWVQFLLRLSPSSAAASSGARVVQVRPVLPVAIRRRRNPARASSNRAKISSSDASPRGRSLYPA